MSSREIAELTAKEHKHVLRDIRVMLTELALEEKGYAQNWTDPQNGQSYTMLAIPKDLTITLVAGYSVTMRHRIVTRWQELEAARPTLSHLEVLAASAQVLVDLDRQQKQIVADVARIEARVEQVAESHVWDHCPANSEPITKIRDRIAKQYGLPSWVVDTVMRELPLSPKVHGMVRNSHADAKGSHYEVWAVADVTRIFRRFVSDCQQETPAYASHPDISNRFRIKAGAAGKQCVSA